MPVSLKFSFFQLFWKKKRSYVHASFHMNCIYHPFSLQWYKLWISSLYTFVHPILTGPSFLGPSVLSALSSKIIPNLSSVLGEKQFYTSRKQKLQMTMVYANCYWTNKIITFLSQLLWTVYLLLGIEVNFILNMLESWSFISLSVICQYFVWFKTSLHQCLGLMLLIPYLSCM
jgi:hypothetical protein